MSIQNEMQFNWMALIGPHIKTCEIIHPNSSCIGETINKMHKVLQMSFKFYLLLHIIPTLIKIYKDRDKNYRQVFLQFMKRLCGSLFFMAHLVGGIKFALCANHRIPPYKFNGYLFTWATFPTSISILWEDSSRREEIVYFTAVRAIRSFYLLLKRRKFIWLDCDKQISFMFLFGMMSFIFMQFPQFLKYQSIFTAIWGKI